MSRVSIPDKLYFSRDEVAHIAGIQPYRLVYWEDVFNELFARDGQGRQRLFTRRELDYVLYIQHLIDVEQYTLEGARRRLYQTLNDNPDASSSFPDGVLPTTSSAPEVLEGDLESLAALTLDQAKDLIEELVGALHASRAHQQRLETALDKVSSGNDPVPRTTQRALPPWTEPETVPGASTMVATQDPNALTDDLTALRDDNAHLRAALHELEAELQALRQPQPASSSDATTADVSELVGEQHQLLDDNATLTQELNALNQRYEHALSELEGERASRRLIANKLQETQAQLSRLRAATTLPPEDNDADEATQWRGRYLEADATIESLREQLAVAENTYAAELAALQGTCDALREERDQIELEFQRAQWTATTPGVSDDDEAMIDAFNGPPELLVARLRDEQRLLERKIDVQHNYHQRLLVTLRQELRDLQRVARTFPDHDAESFSESRTSAISRTTHDALKG